MGKQCVAIVLFVGILLLSTVASHAQLTVKPLNISLWEPVTFPKYDSTNLHYLSLGLLQSKNAHIKGVNLNTIAGRHLGRVDGAALSGLMNITSQDIDGVQASGLWNACFQDFRGLQLSSFSNMTIQNFSGAQFSGVFNFVAGTTKGVQLGLLTNIVGETLCGVQITSVSNITLGETQGAQVGLFNYSEQLYGMQFGGINLSGLGEKKRRGVQIGFINYSADTTTAQLGFINVTKGSKVQMLVSGGTMYYGTAAVRFKKESSYNILGIAAPYLAKPEVYSGAVLYRSGYSYPLNKRVELSADGGVAYISIHNDNPYIEIPKDLWSFQARINIEYRFSKRVGVILTGGWARDAKLFEINEYRDCAFAELGVALF